MNKDTYSTVFAGENSIFDYINPNNFITPLVEIHKEINPFYSEGVRFFAKLNQFSPLAQIKSIPAFEMMNEAKKRGELDLVDTIIEASSGNTSYGLSVVARLHSIKNVYAFVSNEISEKKLKLLKLFNIKVNVLDDPICADASDPNSRIYKAKKEGLKEKCFNPGQYSNNDNPNSHYKYTAKQIWQQTKGDFSIFSTGLGTSGTFFGCSKYFKEKNKDIVCIAGLRAENNMVPGLRTKNQMKEIAFDWEKNLDEYFKISSYDSYKSSLNLIRYGIIAGPSSGLAFETAKKYIEKLKGLDKLDEFRNKKKEVIVVFVCCDFPYLYLDEYFEILGESFFPKVENENLLLKTKKNSIYKTENTSKEIGVFELYKIISKDEKEIEIIDIRESNEYEEHHIIKSKNVELNNVLEYINKNKKKLKNKDKVIFVCNYGEKSKSIAAFAEKIGINSFSLEGGDSMWSYSNLPREKSQICKKKYNFFY